MNLNFQKRFVSDILRGKKIHTLRYGERWKVNQKIHFYTGLPTKNAKLFAIGEVKEIYGVFLLAKEHKFFLVHPLTMQAYADNVLGGSKSLDIDDFWYLLAKNDGFKDFEEMREFFEKNGKEGNYQLILWSLKRGADMINDSLREKIKDWPKMDLEEFGCVFDTFESFFERYKSMDLIEGDREINARRLWVYYQSAAKKIKGGQNG